MAMKRRKPAIFYGYVIIVCCVGIMTMGWGANRTFGVFLEPMLKEFGWTRAEISASFTLNMLVMGVLAIFSGGLVDRLGPRMVIMTCGSCLGLAYILTSQIHSLFQFYICYGVLGGIGMSGMLAPMMALVVKWFVKRRGLMSSILIAGPAVGIMFLPISFSFFISYFGWRASSLILGIVVIIVIILASVKLRREPREMGLLPYSGGDLTDTKKLIPDLELSAREAMRTTQFWIINIVAFSDMFLINAITVHIVIHATDMGISAAAAAAVLSLAAGVSIPGRVLMGWVADRIGNKPSLLLCLGIATFAFFLLLIAKGLGMLYLFAIFYGMGLWASGGIISPLIAEYFGPRAHAALYSFSVFLQALGGAAGALLVGLLFDMTGSYHLSFILCFGVSCASFLALFLLVPIQR
jgi:MFS family permease